MRAFHCNLKHKFLPSPPERGRGVGGEGDNGIPAIERRHEKAERREHQNPCDSSVKIRVHPWQKNNPHPWFIRGSAQQLAGDLHPSHQAPLPFQGRGVPCALTQSQKKTPRQRQVFVLFVCFVDNQIPVRFIRGPTNTPDNPYRVRFSNMYSPDFPGQTRSMSPSASMSTADICSPVPAEPFGKSFSAQRSLAFSGAFTAGSP